MTVGLSGANLAKKWLDMLAGTAFTAPTVFAVKLHTADPGSAGATAAAAGDTTRKSVTWTAATTGGVLAMSSMSGSWTNGGTSETLSHISMWDSTSAGNFLASAALTSSQAWASGNTFSLTSLTISFTPIAA